MRSAVGMGMAAARLVAAALFIGACAYVLDWKVLHQGLGAGDHLFAYHHATMIDRAFPNLPWWYQWDVNGIPYREAYPLVAGWLSVAAGRMSGLGVLGGMQTVDFAVTPLSALGLYAFCAWRLGRPLAGLAAGFLYLLSPITWTELTDVGVFATQVGVVLFMPAMIALDAFFHAWIAGDRGWRYRLSGGAFILFTTAMGLISPAQEPAAFLAVAAYTLAIGSNDRSLRRRWLFVVAPITILGCLVLSSFWILPYRDYFAYIGTRWPGLTYNSNDLDIYPFSSLFQLSPIHTALLGERLSLSPAVTLPALVGAGYAWRDGRTRAWLGLVVAGVVLLTASWIYLPLFAVPSFAQFGVVAHRPAVLCLQFGVPLLAAVGLFSVPAAIVNWWARKRPRRPATFAGLRWGVAALALAVMVADVAVFAERVNESGRLAYGPYRATVGDLWDRGGSTSDVASQLLDLSRWRPLKVTCDLPGCAEQASLLSGRSSPFQTPPNRAELNADLGQLDMAFHNLTGGGFAHSYLSQGLPSQALSSWLEQGMLVNPGVGVKDQLSQILGIDAVALAHSQAGLAGDYAAMGWLRTNDQPIVYVNPRPTGLAAEWPNGTAVLVVGRTQTSEPDLYNSFYKRATSGLLPFNQGWLIRGPSAYIDDYSQADLARYQSLVLLGYQYHDAGRAWELMDGYVRGGGALYVETGWQYADPDWNMSSAPAVLPVNNLRWGPVDAAAPVLVGGAADPLWGPFHYQGGDWGASSAGSLRTGAEPLVQVAGRILAARWRVGKGSVLWSGMNLLSHADQSMSDSEGTAVKAWWTQLMPATDQAQAQIDVQWPTENTAVVPLGPTRGPTWILLKESNFPGWSVRLETPAGSYAVAIEDAEMDFMLVHLDSVPQGSRLVFQYGPTPRMVTWWVTSAFFAVLMLVWLVRPALFDRAFAKLGQGPSWAASHLAKRVRWGEDDDM